MDAPKGSRATGRRFGLAAAAERDASARRRLAAEVQRARVWLPLAIIGIVLLFELGLLPNLGPGPNPWVRLGFYAVFGPLATVITLSWILGEVQGRERAQAELGATYLELQQSHDLLASIHAVTERFALAADVEEAIRAGVTGLRKATGARGSALVLGASDPDLTAEEGLDGAVRDRIRARDARIRGGGLPDDVESVDGGTLHVLSAPVRIAGTIEGSVHAVFDEAPEATARDAFFILAGEFASALEATRGRMRDLLTLFEVDRSVRAEGNLDNLLGRLLERTMQRVDATGGAVFLADDGPLLHPKVVRPDRSLAPLRSGEDRLARLAAAGTPQLIGVIGDELRSEGGGLLADAACAVVLPMTTDDDTLGALVLVHDRPGAVGEAQLPFLALLAGQVATAVRNARAYLASEEVAIGEERSRIAREIHDGVAQSLAFAALKVDLATRLLDRDGDRAREELAYAKTTVRDAIAELRRSIFALRPVDLERHGFVDTVRRYADDFGPQNGIQVEVEVQDVGEVDVRAEAILFRIFQEAMHNVAKHAGARSVTVRLGRDGAGRAFVEVADDGVGFDLDTVEDRVTSAGGLGLRQMRERVEARGGTFDMTSAPGEGTRVHAALG